MPADPIVAILDKPGKKVKPEEWIEVCERLVPFLAGLKTHLGFQQLHRQSYHIFDDRTTSTVPLRRLGDNAFCDMGTDKVYLSKKPKNWPDKYYEQQDAWRYTSKLWGVTEEGEIVFYVFEVMVYMESGKEPELMNAQVHRDVRFSAIAEELSIYPQEIYQEMQKLLQSRMDRLEADLRDMKHVWDIFNRIDSITTYRNASNE